MFSYTLQDEISTNMISTQLDHQPLDFTTLSIPHWTSNLAFARSTTPLYFTHTRYFWVLQKIGLWFYYTENKYFLHKRDSTREYGFTLLTKIIISYWTQYKSGSLLQRGLKLGHKFLTQRICSRCCRNGMLQIGFS